MSFSLLPQFRAMFIFVGVLLTGNEQNRGTGVLAGPEEVENRFTVFKGTNEREPC